MNKILLVAAMAFATATASAQVLVTDFLNGYNPGNELEKGVYTEKGQPIQESTWMGALNLKAEDGACGPKITKGLVYEGFPAEATAINMSGYPTDIKSGRRYSVYSLTRNNNQYKGGKYYLSFLINVDKLGGRGFVDIAAMDINYFGGNGRAKLFIARDDDNMLKFGIGVRKAPEKEEGVGGFDFKKTNLVVLKLDYDNQEVALFVNPDLSGKEPEPLMTVKGEEGEIRHGIKGVSYNYRRGYKGALGSFRFADSWGAAIGK